MVSLTRPKEKLAGGLTTGEVAKLARVAPRTVAQWCTHGRLRYWKVPGSPDRRISPKVLKTFFKEHDMLLPLRDLEHALGETRALVIAEPGASVNFGDLAQRFSAHGYQLVDDTFRAGSAFADLHPSQVFLVGELPRAERIKEFLASQGCKLELLPARKADSRAETSEN